ncbi:transposase [Allopontixanthobacter sp.]|uniref:transposase n=1 Tax=Allopontixanthobacter sp. TaxID=2906452 RepID=UPI002AB98846|nr:transposase [Allopontixanthobacter sp.]MDZ4308351.1 transposase [Allopontixanthobacter sp.]
MIDCVTDQTCSLADMVAALDESGFDARDEESVHHAALWLRRLGNDPDFLGDLMLERLRDRHRETPLDSAYSPQAIMLTHAAGGYFLRANIWPGEQDHAFRASGGGSFVYGTPHDHNFDFLTLGYFGPGYASDYYEYDYEAVSGWHGEPAGLRFVERSTLSPGKLMLYRAHLDVHSQLPPPSMSVSLNVMGMDAAQGWHDQYRFDPASDTITAVLNPTSTETFLRLAVGLGGAEALDLAERFGRTHPSDRMRWASFEARALLLDRAGRDALWRTAELSGNRLVAEEAKRRRREDA